MNCNCEMAVPKLKRFFNSERIQTSAVNLYGFLSTKTRVLTTKISWPIVKKIGDLNRVWGPPSPTKMTAAHPSRHLMHNPALPIKSIKILRHMFSFGIPPRTKSVYNDNSAVVICRQDTLSRETSQFRLCAQATLGSFLPPTLMVSVVG